MMKWFNKKKKDNKGFTLVELVIVVAILALLVGLLAPQYTKYVEKSRKSADAANMDEMVKAVQVYAGDPANELPAGTYTITINKTVSSGDTTVVTLPTLPTDSSLTANKLVGETIPDYAKTVLKSSKWDATPDTPITATIVVDSDGGTKVTYSPADFATFCNKTLTGATSPTTTGTP